MIIAIAPVVLPIALVLALGTGFAWLKLRKGTGGAATDKPSIDPELPSLKMASGGTTAELYRNGPVWAFKVTGSAPATGTDADAGAAAVDMAQSFGASIAGSPDAPIAGAASGPDNDPMEFSIEQDQDIWRWTITREVEAKVPGIPAVPQFAGSGSPETRSRAVLEVLAEISKRLDWLTPIAGPEGSGAPSPDLEPVRLPGIVVSGKNLAITNLPAWLDYAAPLVRGHLTAGDDADAIMDTLLGNYPDDARINGRSLAFVQHAVNKSLATIKDSTYLDVDPPDETIAALMVGAIIQEKLRHKDWWVSRYKDHVIVVRPAKAAAPQGGNFGANLGDRWEWMIWTGNARGYDTTVREVKVMPAGKKKNAAIRDARERIDANFVNFDDGGNQSATADPDYGKTACPDGMRVSTERLAAIAAATTPAERNAASGLPLCVPIVCPAGLVRDYAGRCVDPSDIELDGVIEQEISASWLMSTSREIVIFDFADGSNRARRDWTIGIGVCLEALGELPFGLLTEVLEGGGAPFGGQFGDPMARFQILEANAPNPNAIGPALNAGTKVDDWEQFRSPVAFREQFQAKFERGPLVMVPQRGMVPAVKITKAPAKKANAEIDPCDGDTNFPVPERAAGFIVEAAMGPWTTWKPVPKIEIRTSGTKIILKIVAVGLPSFALGDQGLAPALDFATTYDLRVHVRATGMNP